MSPRIRDSAFLASFLLLLAMDTPALGAPWGIRGGLSGGYLRGDGLDSDSKSRMRPGFSAGVYRRFSLRGPLSIQAEIALTQKGDREDILIRPSPYSPEVEPTTIEVRDRIEYLEIPVLLRYDLPARGFLQPYVIGGPALAIQTGSDRELRGGGLVFPNAAEPDGDVERSIRDPAGTIYEGVGTLDSFDPESYDVLASAGLGVMLGRGNLRAGLEARYAHGFVDVYPQPLEAWNAGFTLTLSLELR